MTRKEPETNYASEKYWVGVRNLAVTTGSIQDRLMHAFLSIMRLTRENLPDDLWREHNGIIERMTSYKDGPKERGHAKNTLDRLSESEASQLADQIVSMLFKIEDFRASKV